jgi:glycosyltransferase involved in cell wall biosynthesis
MELPSPLLSIVIPTKNRYETLFPTLGALLDNIVGNSYEIVIQDNSDHPAAAHAYMQGQPDTRVQYAHLAGFISIVENTEEALSRARGEYITFIGDDDLVAPNILEFVQRFWERGIDAVIYPPAYYWWPSVRFVTPTRYHQPGALWYPPVTSASEQCIDTVAELNRVTSQGAVALFDLPKVYHGIVRKRVLEAIKARTGLYVNGASPDMALAIAVAHEVSSHVKVDTPLTIYGASKNSGGGWTAAKSHFGKISEQPHLPQYTKDLWSDRIPPIWSEHTIYPQTAMEVMRFMGRPDTINYGAFYASMLVNEPHLRPYVLPFVVRFLAQKPQSGLFFAALVVKKFIGRLHRGLRARVTGLPFQLYIFETPDACMKHLIERNRTRRS